MFFVFLRELRLKPIVELNQEFSMTMTEKPHAEYCKNVRPFDDLLFDIINWTFEELRHFNVSQTSPNEFSQQKSSTEK